MNTINKATLLVVFAIFLTACSSKVYTEKPGSAPLSRYKTYQWVDTQPSQTKKRKSDFIDMELAIRDITNQTLLRKGLTLVNENADILLNYDAMVDRSVVEGADPAYLQSYSPGYFHPYTNSWTSLSYPAGLIGWDGNLENVTKASFVLTMTEAGTNSKLWQGWTTQKIGNNGLQPQEARDAVENILEKLSPVK